MLGEPIELPDYLAAVNNLRRVLATIGLERKARDVGGLTLGDLMRMDIEDRQREAANAPAVELGDPEALSAEAISETPEGAEGHASDGAPS